MFVRWVTATTILLLWTSSASTAAAGISAWNGEERPARQGLG